MAALPSSIDSIPDGRAASAAHEGRADVPRAWHPPDRTSLTRFTLAGTSVTAAQTRC